MREPCAEPLSHRYGLTFTHSDSPDDIVHYRLARKHKNERNGEYNHGDHINKEDDDYNDTSKLVVMITNLKGFPGIKK